MKITLLFTLLLLVGCGNHPLVTNGKIYDCYGAFDYSEVKDKNVRYELSGNIIGTFLLFETVFVPIWNLGWNTYCPVEVIGGKK